MTKILEQIGGFVGSKFKKLTVYTQEELKALRDEIKRVETELIEKIEAETKRAEEAEGVLDEKIDDISAILNTANLKNNYLLSWNSKTSKIETTNTVYANGIKFININEDGTIPKNEIDWYLLKCKINSNGYSILDVYPGRIWFEHHPTRLESNIGLSTKGKIYAQVQLELATSGNLIRSFGVDSLEYGHILHIPDSVNAAGKIPIIRKQENLSYFSSTNIINDLTTGGTENLLSAEQGKVLNTNLTAEVERAAAAEKALSDSIDTVKDTYLPLAGGTMTGSIVMNGGALMSASGENRMFIWNPSSGANNFGDTSTNTIIRGVGDLSYQTPGEFGKIYTDLNLKFPYSIIYDINFASGSKSSLFLRFSTFKATLSGRTAFIDRTIPEVTDKTNGLMTPSYKAAVDKLVPASGESLSIYGTPSQTWQLDLSTGPKIKNSGGAFELRNSDDSAYSNLTLQNLTIKGNVTQEGDSFITNAETVEVKDNILLLNNGETGAGVTAGVAGIEIDRGTEPSYKFLFDESSDRFKVGKGNDLWCAALRDNDTDMTDGYFTMWDSSTKRLFTSNTVPEAGLNFDTLNVNYYISNNDNYEGLSFSGDRTGYLDLVGTGTSWDINPYSKSVNIKGLLTANSIKRGTDNAEVVYKPDIDTLKTELETIYYPYSGRGEMTISATGKPILENSSALVFRKPDKSEVYSVHLGTDAVLYIGGTKGNNVPVRIPNSNLMVGSLTNNTPSLSLYKGNDAYRLLNTGNRLRIDSVGTVTGTLLELQQDGSAAYLKGSDRLLSESMLTYMKSDDDLAGGSISYTSETVRAFIGRQRTNANATTANGYPTNLAGTLYSVPSVSHLHNQIYHSYSENRLFYRASKGSPAEYTNWKEVISKQEFMDGSITFIPIFRNGIKLSDSDHNIGVFQAPTGDAITIGNSIAKKLYTYGLLVSNVWTDSTKIPERGIYSSGAIHSGTGYLLQGNRVATVNVLKPAAFANMGVRFDSFTSGATNAPGADAVKSSSIDDGFLQTFFWDSESIAAQIAIDADGSGMAYRSYNPTTTAQGEWKFLADTTWVSNTFAKKSDITGGDLSGSGSNRYLAMWTGSKTLGNGVALAADNDGQVLRHNGTWGYPLLVDGAYTKLGGVQPPGYVPSGKVRFNMMFVNLETGSNANGFADWILMDTYTNNDVPYVTGIGVTKSPTPRMFIVSGPKGNEDEATWVRREVITVSDDSIRVLYKRALNINGEDLLYTSPTSGTAKTTMYIPTTSGTNGQILQSKGDAAPVWVNSPYLSLTGGTLTGKLTTTSDISFTSTSSSNTSGLSFYNSSYMVWKLYMSADKASTGGSASRLGNVSSWALRSTIENVSGYGWVWDSCTNAANTNPIAMMALSSNNGNLYVKGSITSNSKIVATSISSGNTIYSANSSGVIDMSADIYSAKVSRTAKTFLAAPAASNGTAGFRTIVADDLPTIPYSKISGGPSGYSLPLAASGTRGGIQIGFSASGAYVPVQLSSEKAYVALTKTAVTSALGYTPPASDTNTHYVTRLYAGTSTTVLNGATANPYLKVTDDNTFRNQIQFKGAGATVVSSDTNGVITIESTDTNTNTNYYLSGWAWNNGTTAGPTASATRSGTSDLSIPAFPSASGTTSGVVTIGTQTFAGVKTFTSRATFSAGAGLASSSDIRFKNNQKELDSVLYDVLEAPVITYNWKDEEERVLGTSAQYWEDKVPELVCEQDDKNKTKLFMYDRLSCVLMKALQEEHEMREREKIIHDLEMKEVKKELAELREFVDKLKNLINI